MQAKASHEERFETRDEGKAGEAGEAQPKPQPHNELG